MFASKKQRDNQFASGGHTLFDRAVEIRGDVRFGGTLDIEGTVIGNITAVDGSDALLRVRNQGCVNGEIRSPKVIVNGSVTGDIYTTKHLELAANAVVDGNVHYTVIEMVKGAKVSGNLVYMEGKEAKPQQAERPMPEKESKPVNDSGDPALSGNRS